MRTLILGGGFGGLAAATELRRLLPEEHEIVLVDRGDRFLMGFRKLWILTGMEEPEGGSRPLTALEGRGIRFVRTEVRGIDAAARRVETAEGGLEADALIVALGAEPRRDLVPGLAEHGTNLYDIPSVRDAAPRVASLEAGRVHVVVAGVPYKCPPAPYEASMLLDAAFRRRGVRDAIEISVTTLQPALLPPAGPEGNAWLTGELKRRGIRWETGRRLVRLEAGRLHFEDGESPFDMALVVPPHRPPKAVVGSELVGPSGWIHVDPRTLATDHPGVWAVGDCVHVPLAGEAALPKAGVFAEAEGRLVAAAIAAQVTGGDPPPPYDGVGACFLETSPEEAALVEGDFFAEPAPRVRILQPSPEHARAKRRFEAERLERWFGS
jgi:sulfide:quinone oxidoreductase